MADVAADPAPRGPRWAGSVRFRVTAAVTVLFAVALALAAFLIVNRVQVVLVDEVFTRDTRTLEQLRADLANARPPQVLPRLARLGSELQVVDVQGRVIARTAGAPEQALTGPAVPLGPLRNVRPGAPVPSDGAGNPVPTNPAGNPVPTNPTGNPVPTGPAGNPVPTDPAGNPLPGGPVGNPVPRPTVVPNGPGNRAGAGAPAEPAAAPTTARISAADALGTGAGDGELAVTVLPAATVDGPVSVVAVSSLAGVADSMAAMTRTLWLTMPLLVVLIGATAWLVAGRALRPVEDLTRRVEEISTSTLHERVPVPAARDEVAHLAATMNAMLGRLEEGAARQRRFVSDASHELRTPVASIRTELEVALAHPDRADWAAVAANVLAEDARLDQIVADLLLLARFDERPELVESQLLEVDLDDVARSEAARTRRLPVGTAAVAHARVAGRPEELARLTGHLLDNAVRHAAGRVEVEVVPDGGVVWLRVDDDGPGVPEEDRTRIFERFGRLDEGRARDAGGAGLGLAVVQRIALRHHGVVRVQDSPLGGARFEVLFPRLAVDAPYH